MLTEEAGWHDLEDFEWEEWDREEKEREEKEKEEKGKEEKVKEEQEEETKGRWQSPTEEEAPPQPWKPHRSQTCIGPGHVRLVAQRDVEQQGGPSTATSTTLTTAEPSLGARGAQGARGFSGPGRSSGSSCSQQQWQKQQQAAVGIGYPKKSGELAMCREN